MKWSSIIAIISTIINIILCGVVCYVVLLMVPCHKSLCVDDILNYIGIIIACFSILLTGFFAFHAVDAYSKVREFNDKLEEQKKILESSIDVVSKVGPAVKTSYEVAIEMVDMLGRSNKDEKSQKKYKKQRLYFNRNYNRLGLNPFLLSNEERMSFIRNLRSFAQEEDIEELEKICKSKTESPEIKRVAKEVLDSFNSSKPTIIHQSICERIKSRLNTFFNGQCELFKELIRG